MKYTWKQEQLSIFQPLKIREKSKIPILIPIQHKYLIFGPGPFWILYGVQFHILSEVSLVTTLHSHFS